MKRRWAIRRTGDGVLMDALYSAREDAQDAARADENCPGFRERFEVVEVEIRVVEAGICPYCTQHGDSNADIDEVMSRPFVLCGRHKALYGEPPARPAPPAAPNRFERDIADWKRSHSGFMAFLEASDPLPDAPAPKETEA